MSSNTLLNYSKICRTCLGEKELMLSIHDAFLDVMLMKCTEVKVAENDGFPQRICTECIKKLNKSHAFKELCEKSDSVLRAQQIKVCKEESVYIIPVPDDLEPLPVINESEQDFNKFIENKTDLSLELNDLLETNSIANEFDSVDVDDSDYINSDSNADDSSDDETISKKKSRLAESQKTDSIEPDTTDTATQSAGNNELKSEVASSSVIKFDPEFIKKTRERLEKNKSFTQCIYCKKSFQGGANLNRHIKQMHLHTATKINLNQDVDGNKKYQCNLCNSSFTSKYNILTHLKIHEKSRRKYKSNDTHFVGHLRNRSPRAGLKPFQCTYCPKSFKTRIVLTRHLYIHTGERPFICSHCGKGTTTKANLISHMRIHTGDRPFQCDTCGSKFAHYSAWLMHKRRHTGEKPIKCTVCDKNFISKGEMNEHMRYHTGDKRYLCTICGKKFINNKHLKTHLRSHSGERPHKCKICNRAFSVARSLRLHLATHNIKLPIVCEVCDEGFSEQSHLKSHMRMHDKK